MNVKGIKNLMSVATVAVWVAFLFSTPATGQMGGTPSDWKQSKMQWVVRDKHNPAM